MGAVFCWLAGIRGRLSRRRDYQRPRLRLEARLGSGVLVCTHARTPHTARDFLFLRPPLRVSRCSSSDKAFVVWPTWQDCLLHLGELEIPGEIWMIGARAWQEDLGCGEATSRAFLVRTSSAWMLGDGDCTGTSSRLGDMASGLQVECYHLKTLTCTFLPSPTPGLLWQCGNGCLPSVEVPPQFPLQRILFLSSLHFVCGKPLLLLMSHSRPPYLILAF